MNKMIRYSLWLITSLVLGQGPYSPPAGEEGSEAIHMDSDLFVAWATGIEVERGYINLADTNFAIDSNNKASFGEPSDGLGKASGITTSVVSFGDGGSAILTFDQPIVNGPGSDFAIFENAVTPNFLELAHVEVSSNGIDFIRFPSHSLTPVTQQTGPFGSTDARNVNNLAGKYKVGFGTPFDLEELKDVPELDVMNITHVKIIDVVGSIDDLGTLDSFGNKINDPFPTPFESSGFDLDGVGVIHQKTVNNVEKELSGIHIYPNPSKGKINVTGVDEPMFLQLYSSTGVVVNEWLLEKNDIFYLNVPNGLYFAKCITKQGINEKTFKIVVNN